MAKIDVTKIEGFEDLSAEEKVNALLGFEYDDGSHSAKEIEKLKNSITKLTSENADWKRKYNDKLSDEEKRAIEEQERISKLQADYDALVKENRLKDVTANYVALGYDSELALDTAKATLDGDVAKVMENQKRFLETYQKSVLAKAMNETPKPEMGVEKKGFTLDDFRKMSAGERLAFAREHEEEYKALYSKEGE